MNRTITLGLIILLASGGILAQNRPGHGRMGGGNDRGQPSGSMAGEHMFGHDGLGFFADLNDEQRATLRELVTGLRESGATREAIHDAVAAQFEAWGLELPEFAGRMPHRGPAFCVEGLSNEQRDALRELAAGLRETGATRDEVHTAVVAQLAEWGFDAPDCKPFGGRGFADLNEEQRAELAGLLAGLRETEATRDEIRAAVDELFASWGLEAPAHRPGRRGHGGHRGMWLQQLGLTDAQIAEVHDLAASMRSDGATRQEIHDAIAELLAGWGFEGGPEGRDTERPERRIQAGNHPNPFNPETQISYSLSNTSAVRVTITNINGATVRSYNMGTQTPGSYSVTWNGRLSTGNPAPSGVYFYTIQAGADALTQRMLLLK